MQHSHESNEEMATIETEEEKDYGDGQKCL